MGVEYNIKLPWALPAEVPLQQSAGLAIKFTDESSTIKPVAEAGGLASCSAPDGKIFAP